MDNSSRVGKNSVGKTNFFQRIIESMRSFHQLRCIRCILKLCCISSDDTYRNNFYSDEEGNFLMVEETTDQQIHFHRDTSNNHLQNYKLEFINETIYYKKMSLKKETNEKHEAKESYKYYQRFGVVQRKNINNETQAAAHNLQ